MRGAASGRLATKPDNTVRLVVVEDGADPIDVHALAGDGYETVVIGQGHEEGPVDLMYRVVHRLSALEQAGRRVDFAVLRVAPRLDQESMAARNLVARALLTHSAVAGPTELVFGAGAPLGKGLRLRLLALVEELIQDSVSGSTTLRIQFDEPVRPDPPHSGVIAIAPAVAPATRSDEAVERVRPTGTVRSIRDALGSIPKGA